MRRGKLGADDPQLWLDYAKSDLALAKNGRKVAEVRMGALCFHAQQAAEKAIKALLIKSWVPFPKIHDIGELFQLLPTNFSPPPKVKEAAELSQFVEKGRYPLDFVDVEEKDYKKAVVQAETVVKWVEKVLRVG